MKSKTIKNEIILNGISLFSGNIVNCMLYPSKRRGIRFYVDDVEILPSDIVSTNLSTTIGKKGKSIRNIEHLMSCLHAHGIDCLDIVVYGDSIPFMDGSAKQIYELISETGVVDLDIDKKFIRTGYFEIIEKDKYIIGSPSDTNDLDIFYEIRFKESFIGRRYYNFKLSSGDYEKEIVGAKTFIHVEDGLELKRRGLVKGYNDNCILFDDHKVLNDEHYDVNLFVRHKILDFIGDIYSYGPISGKFICCCAGHSLTHKFLKGFLEKIGK